MAKERNGLSREQVLDAIQKVAKDLGRAPSRAEFSSKSGISEYHVYMHFGNWSKALDACGLTREVTNQRVEEAVLLGDWGAVARRNKAVPTVMQYRRDGKHSPSLFQRRFGPWSNVLGRFREFADGNPEWQDVLALLPTRTPGTAMTPTPPSAPMPRRLPIADGLTPGPERPLTGPTYGDPIDFRGLRHEPVNEHGVVFLFGMVARELGYLVEAVQSGFPDCEAKRQVRPQKWQRVRIEFEFESRNFRDHAHPETGCDVIVCWRHNWPECPPHIQVIELAKVIKILGKT